MKSNPQLVSELYSRFGPVVYRRCLRLLGNREEAEDATQQVFIRLLKHQHRFANIEEAIPWIIGVATNYCRNHHRDFGRRADRLHLESSGREDRMENNAALAAEDRQLAMQVLEQLDDASRHIAIGVLIHEREQQDVAAELGVSDKTVQRKLKRALESARKFLGRSGS